MDVCEVTGKEEKITHMLEMASWINERRPGYMRQLWEDMDLDSMCELRGCKLDRHYEVVYNDYHHLKDGGEDE